MSKLFSDEGFLQLSVSSLEAFKTCPRKFYYGKVERLSPQVGDGLQGGPLVVGTAVHNLIEAVYAGRGALSVPLDHMDSDSIAKSQAGLAAYMTYSAVYDDFKIVEQESEFSVPVENDHGIKLQLRGRIDGKAEYANGERIIIEYKTASQFWSREKKSLAEQGVLYELASEETDGHQYHGTLWNFIRMTQRAEFRGGPKVWYGEVQRELKPANEHARFEVYQNVVETGISILETLAKERESAFHRVPGEQCRWCDFRILCQTAYNGGDVEYLKTEYFTQETDEVETEPDAI